MRTPVKYFLMQLPGWVIAAAVLLGLRHWSGLSLWIIGGLFGVWVLKDLLMYPFLRVAYESGVKTGAEDLVGCRAVARESLSPSGYVHIRGELWRAEADPKGIVIPAGTPVTVVGVDRMTLIVRDVSALQTN